MIDITKHVKEEKIQETIKFISNVLNGDVSDLQESEKEYDEYIQRLRDIKKQFPLLQNFKLNSLPKINWPKLSVNIIVMTGKKYSNATFTPYEYTFSFQKKKTMQFNIT